MKHKHAHDAVRLSPRVAHRDVFVRYRRSHLSMAVLALVCATLDARPAMAQSVTGVGDVNPGPVQTPDWTVPTEIYVGDTGGVGTLTIQGGGTASSSSGTLGYTGGDGTAVVTGSDGSGNVSSWTMPGQMNVGAGGTASLSILDGGLVSNGFGIIANGGGTASVTVSGVDAHGNVSTWLNSSPLTVGYEGAGSLLIEDGGLVRSDQGNIGGSTGATPGLSSGTVTVSGSDGNGRVSTWEVISTISTWDSPTSAISPCRRVARSAAAPCTSATKRTAMARPRSRGATRSAAVRPA